MKEALVLTGNSSVQTLDANEAQSRVDFDLINSKGAKLSRQATNGKRAVYIYPRVLKALNNATRRRILVLLKDNQLLSFTEMKKGLGDMQNASLSRHLNILQRADLIDRRVELGSPRTAKDAYYSFYSMSAFGRNFLSLFSEAVTQSASLSPCSK